MRDVRLWQGDFNLLIRFIFIVIALVLLPSVFMKLVTFQTGAHRDTSGYVANRDIETISDELLRSVLPAKKSCAVGLVTNHPAMDPLVNRNVDRLLARGIRVKKIITSQQGYSKNVSLGTTKIPILRLNNRQLTKADITDLDVILFDARNRANCRNSCIQTLSAVMELAAKTKKIVVAI